MSTKDEMNTNMYNASIHLVEAAKYLSDVDVSFAEQIMIIADRILSIIEAPPQKVSDDRMSELLTDILESDG